MQPETSLAIATMITGFAPSTTDPDTQIRAYLIAADGCRDDAIRSACKRFIRGEVKDHKASRLPTVAEFALECKSEHSAISARENRRPTLPKPDEETPSHTPEHRAKMRELIYLWKRAWGGDGRAQRALRGRGWHSDDDVKDAAE